jgi:hypothetical protein
MKGFRNALHLLLLAETATAFLPGTPIMSTSTSTLLRGHISEWRDLMFENVPKELVGDTNEGEPVREVCILPFPLTDVLLQGETKELCLYEERYVGTFVSFIEDNTTQVCIQTLLSWHRSYSRQRLEIDLPFPSFFCARAHLCLFHF